MATHNSLTCNKPFCSECWKIIKANIQRITGVADDLRRSSGATEESPTPEASKEEQRAE